MDDLERGLGLRALVVEEGAQAICRPQRLVASALEGNSHTRA